MFLGMPLRKPGDDTVVTPHGDPPPPITVQDQRVRAGGQEVDIIQSGMGRGHLHSHSSISCSPILPSTQALTWALGSTHPEPDPPLTGCGSSGGGLPSLPQNLLPLSTLGCTQSKKRNTILHHSLQTKQRPTLGPPEGSHCSNRTMLCLWVCVCVCVCVCSRMCSFHCMCVCVCV